ncbi:MULTISPECIES: YHYH protein [unclassified Aureispira]|uniref:YHYH protein n=1 Tax=unclassified Aureispira TaxID=2649989 RepID=UPI000696BACC|nr:MULTISPECIES: YHYH protein [unclassified Aureispira]WMX15491.1 YHYH protein [Aureispira sp. CCB-E]
MKCVVPILFILTSLLLFACREQPMVDCTPTVPLNTSRGACNQNLTPSSAYSESINGHTRVITANNIPEHKVGLFGGGQGSLNPNAISPQNAVYRITTTPTKAASKTELLSSVGPVGAFGILMNGVELDPIAAEPWPHQGMMAANVNWTWNLEATNVQLGLDCNNAHVQPTGKYHYHASPTLYLQSLNINTTTMTQIGWAADGFPIYYKYGYSDPLDNTSAVVALTASYQLKTGERPGNGSDGPCGAYNGIYSNDYEYIPSLGMLDECNGRTGVTPEFPGGTYYYVITDEFPSVPRCLMGIPSNDFKLR